MVTNRYIEEKDYHLLSDSLAKDAFHQGTGLDFFLETGTVCSVYEDESGPVLFVRGKPLIFSTLKIIQLDIQYLNNMDAKRNMRAMLEGLPELATKAKTNGFDAFYFISNVPLLRKFCVKRLGFVEFDENILVKFLDENTGVVV
jgi:hypothetical protein